MSINIFKNFTHDIEKNIGASFNEVVIGRKLQDQSQPISKEFILKITAKRIIDIIIGSLFFMFALPLIIIISIMIKLNSPGPVFFRQRRVALRGKLFNIKKFRTMKPDESENDHKEYIRDLLKEQDDIENIDVNLHQVDKYLNYLEEKTTRIGRLLRRTSLDELPQLLNILAGEMSLVGPRPHPLYEVQEYKNWYLRRLDVKPGLAGWSKLKLRLTPENYEEAILYDLWYVDNWTNILDSKILLMTVPHVLLRREAH